MKHERIAWELNALVAHHMVARNVGDDPPETNAHQTLVAARVGRRWQVVLSQNTPAAFHGRPDLVEAMTQELQRELEQRASPSREL